jgi:hypothetical protein
MATVIWKGDAPAVAKEMRATPGNVEIGDIFTLTINNRSVSFTATAATVANVTAGLTAAWNSSTVPEHAEITASDETTYVKLLGDTAGVDFTITSSTTNGGSTDDQTLTMSTPTAASGPNCWDTADNWSGGSVPSASDDVILENSASSILYGLDQSSVALTSLRIKATYTGHIGLPRTNANGYVEYRETYLKIDATTIKIGEDEGSGSGRIRIATGTTVTTMSIYKTGTAAETGIPCVLWKSGAANNVLIVNRGSVGVAFFGGETAQVATLKVGHITSPSSDAKVRCGIGLTLTTVVQRSGELELNSSATTITQHASYLHLCSAAAVTTLNLYGGTCYLRSTGTIATLNINGEAILDCRQDMCAKAITTCNAYKGATIQDPAATVTWGGAIGATQCRLSDLTLDCGEHQNWTLAAK